jgi:RimJ/RimL family protein N-acetyltransferase
METLVEEKPAEVKVENKTLVQLRGRKTMLFPFHINDMLAFIRLHRNDRKGYLGQFCFKYMSEAEAVNYLHHLLAFNKIHIWTAYTKEIKSRFAGFVYLSDIEKYKCVISGVMDTEFVHGLSRELRRDKYTYSEDAFRALIRHVFTTSIIRIEANCTEGNRLSFNLCKKVGFVIEGCRRKAMEMDGEFYNVLYLSILKEEHKDAI